MNRSLLRTRAACLAVLFALTPACVKLPRRSAPAGDKAPPPVALSESASQTRISLNRATPEELSRLPGVGPVLAARIVEHRERYGRFRRPEQLLIVRGISERRFRQLRALLSVE